METPILFKARQIMRAAPTAVIALTHPDGYPHATTISSLRVDDDFSAFFATSLSSGKVSCLRHSPKMGLCYATAQDNVSLMGLGIVLTDAELKRSLWLDDFKEHFPGGPDDADYCLIKFKPKQISLWVSGQCYFGHLGEFICS